MADKDTKKDGVLEWVKTIAYALILAGIIRTLFFQPFWIPSGSMKDTLLIGDFLFVNKFAYGIRMPVTKQKLIELGEPDRGDIVVFRWPKNPRLDYIKRVVGLPGDRIRYQKKTLFINGEPAPIEVVGQYQPEGSGMRALGSVEGRETLGDMQHSILVNPMAADFSPSCGFLGYREVT